MHGAAFLGVAPFAPDKAGGIVVVAHIFSGGKGDHLTDLTIQDPLLDGGVERRITQHVADHHHGARLFVGGTEFIQFGQADGHRLFEQDVVSFFKQRQRGGHVQFVHRAIDDGISQTGLCTQFFHVFKKHGVIQRELLLDRFTAVG